MAEEIQKLSELFALEKAGEYEVAFERLQAMTKDEGGESHAKSFNMKLLEQRLRSRLQSSQLQPKITIAQNKPAQQARLNDKKTATWSAIITMWKRKDYLAEQLAAIRSQSIPPQEIIIILNEGHIPESTIRDLGGDDIKIIRSDINSLYSRWAIAYIAQGEYVSIFDDDVIPGKFWIANAMRVCTSYNALVGPSGRIYNKNGLHGYYKLVVPNGNNLSSISCAETDVYCDWVCNSYFFKREWVNYALSRPRHKESSKTFDDIQLATSLYLNGGIRCVAPMQPSFNTELHGSLQHQYGNDVHAIWKTNSDRHFAERKDYIEMLIESGFVHVQDRGNLHRFHLIIPFGDRTMLERCLLSVKGQDYKNFTCTLIDDCGDGKDAIDIIRRLRLDTLSLRYIRTTKKAHPLRARELATDMLGASPADVIVHLDGDDWLPYPDVLSRLNRIYRNGGVLVTYGNALCMRGYQTRDFREYSQYDMSKKWNVAQKDPSAKVFPFRRIEQEEVSNGWDDAPWCGMHLRSFQFSKWMGLSRQTFRDSKGEYLRVGTDAAILIPILNSCSYESVKFVPELSYVYQNSTNTIHAKNEISAQKKSEALALIAGVEQVIDCQSIFRHLVDGPSSVTAKDAAVVHDFFHEGEHSKSNSFFENIKNIGTAIGSIITIVTPNYLADAIICLKSYQRNLRDNDCKLYVFVATDNPGEIAGCAKLACASGIVALFPHTLRYSRERSSALAEKYQLNTDEYRWAMKAVVLLELLNEGHLLAIFLDPDTYTVSDITDVHEKLTRHPISVFPHFRDPDHEYLRSVLYKDGFFNGGMLAATPVGAVHLIRLYERCLHELVKEPARHRWDDQKYFDLFALEVPNLYVNQDQGIDYNYWNYVPVEGLVAPSQRSMLLHSGYFVRHWHISTTLIKESIELKDKKFSIYRPILSIYLLSLSYTIMLLLAHARANGLASENDYLGIEKRFDSITVQLMKLSGSIPINEIRQLIVLAKSLDRTTSDGFLVKWSESLTRSICFDNYEYFAKILGDFFPTNSVATKIQQRLRRYDLRYVTDEVVASPDLSSEEKKSLLEMDAAGNLVRSQIQALQSSKINY